MQKWILKYRSQIMVVTGILILLALFSHFISLIEGISDGLLLIASVIGALPIMIQAFQALRVKVISIDLLVTLAILGALLIQNYEESAVVAFLFLFGAYLEQRTLDKTRSAIQELVTLAPETGWRKTDTGGFEEVEIDDIDPNDILLVKTGGKVPVDGQVVLGEGTINESSITGESLPTLKKIGDSVYAGSIVENGTLQVIAEKVGEDTTFGKIINLVEEAQDSKSEVERFIDRFSRYYTPTVLVLSLLVGVITRNLELAVTILVLGCPGALVIGVPVSNVSGIGNGARHGILLKGSEVITRFSKVDTILFDKTGTLTYGKPQVSEVIGYTLDSQLAINYLVSVEAESDHPLARAIVDYYDITDVEVVTSSSTAEGGGIIATLDGHSLIVGNQSLLQKKRVQFSETAQRDRERLEQEGNSIVLVALDGILSLAIGIKDQIRTGLKEDLQRLKQFGVKNLIVLSGDNQGTVDLVAHELSLTQALGNLLPADKADYVKKLQADDQIVAFVGDGINDSPSLALADIGIAMGSGTDVAIETSNVVLMTSDFHHLVHALGLAKATRRNMIENIIIALAVVLVLLLSVAFSSWMNMAIGMFVHEASILVVIINGMRLLRYKLS